MIIWRLEIRAFGLSRDFSIMFISPQVKAYRIIITQSNILKNSTKATRSIQQFLKEWISNDKTPFNTFKLNILEVTQFMLVNLEATLYIFPYDGPPPLQSGRNR